MTPIPQPLILHAQRYHPPISAPSAAQRQSFPSPADVGRHARIFFEENIKWLTSALTTSSRLSEAKAKAYAIQILAGLEGAMILSKSLGNDAMFEVVAKGLIKLADS